MPTPDEAAIRAALAKIKDPLTGRDVVSAGRVQGVNVSPSGVSVTLEIDPKDAAVMEPVRTACERALRALPGAANASVILTAHRHGGPARPQGAQSAAAQRIGIPGVRAIVAVASGKGGVGKSTVAVNLAVALAREGKRVGLLDADIYGPSVPHLLGLKGKPESDGKKVTPMRAFGLKVMSIGFMVDTDTPMIWRGPMVMSALSQMLADVDWGDLDVLVVDMPPGTGDAQLTLVQRVALAGAVIVSTPQDIALIDARKGLAMFRKTGVPILGLVENMALYICPQCGHEAHIFGHGGARETAEKLGCDFLGEIPLHLAIREQSDAGAPIVAAAPESREAQAFAAIARKVAAKLDSGAAQKPAPRIVVT